MTPSNDHEREIAEIIDRLASKGDLTLSAIQTAVNAIDFVMIAQDNEFFMDYFRWRMANPIVE